MLSPKRTKYRKPHRGRLRGRAYRGTRVSLGDFGIQATEMAWVTSRQIESSRRVLARYTRRGGKLWIRIFPDKSIIQRPAETRIGSGKGSPSYWVAVVYPGTILFEVQGVSEVVVRRIIHIVRSKLPTKVQICY
jgi:large subunit ribosomal protein L16